jgi:hypothetical protein
VTVAYSLQVIGDIIIRLALFLFGLSYTLPFLVVSYTDFSGIWLFLDDTLKPLAYCFQPILGSGQLRMRTL